MLSALNKHKFVVILLLLCVTAAFGQEAPMTKTEAMAIYQPQKLGTAPRGAQPVPPTVLQVDVEKCVVYVGDSTFDKLTTSPAPSQQQPKAFTQNTGIGDVVAVNGKPARGMWLLQATTVLTTPNPSPTTGISIGDVERLAIVNQSVEILKPDMTPIGTVMSVGPGFGLQPPGAPLAAHLSNTAVVGGTGAYLGARGQLSTTGLHADSPVRFASASEIPALRRMNGGGTLNFIIHIIPAVAPEVVFLDDYLPAVFHSMDQTLVTSANPATPGEVIAVLAKGLGPTTPGVDPGQPFPRTPLNIANSNIEVLVNGEPANVIFAGGEPGSVDIFDVEFRLPTKAASGRATVQIVAGFIKGAPFEVTVR